MRTIIASMLFVGALAMTGTAVACHNPTGGGHYGLPCETQEWSVYPQRSYEPYRHPEPPLTSSGTIYESPVYSQPPPTMLELFERPYNDPMKPY